MEKLLFCCFLAVFSKGWWWPEPWALSSSLDFIFQGVWREFRKEKKGQPSIFLLENIPGVKTPRA